MTGSGIFNPDNPTEGVEPANGYSTVDYVFPQNTFWSLFFS